jgi:hypothetical protein
MQELYNLKLTPGQGDSRGFFLHGYKVPTFPQGFMIMHESKIREVFAF